jgi:phosphate transport system protein
VERHFQHELEGLKTSLIKMGSLVEGGYHLAIKAVREQNSAAAHTVVDADERIDALELEIDNAIIDLLALQQPVARDLRFIIASQKLNNELERIGDHCVNIAQSALTLLESPPPASMEDVSQMTNIVGRMLRDALDSFIHLDPILAREVLNSDDLIDDLNRKLVKQVIEALKANAMSIETGMELARLSRNLERIADLSTNISEEVIFLAQARVVKHHADDRGERPDQRLTEG